MARTTEITVDGRQLRLSNLAKVLYPEGGFTKGQVIEYYTKIAPVILPHLTDRALTLKRYPDGVGGMHFYEKQCPAYHPPWVKIKSVPREGSEGNIDYCVVNNTATLLWVANLASIELHTLLSTKRNIHRPTMMVFDFDPGPPATVLDAVRIALRVRDVLADLKLECFAKTSGGKGIHLFVPLHTPVTFDVTNPWSHAIAEMLEQDDPAHVVSRMARSLRAGKVFIDWSQNTEHKTTVCAYSLRARERPTVSTPVTWEELETALKKKRADSLAFETDAVLKRVAKLGDLLAPVLTLKQKLPALTAVR